MTLTVNVKDNNIEQALRKNLTKRKKFPIFLDLGSGALIDYDQYNLPKEKLVQSYIPDNHAKR